uniref:Uncharacterized protein n=1 Tax=Oryza meridionalis TaxID=40149 RepID=A0A0E0DP33_9ORYZ
MPPVWVPVPERTLARSSEAHRKNCGNPSQYPAAFVSMTVKRQRVLGAAREQWSSVAEAHDRSGGGSFKSLIGKSSLG